MNAMNNNSKLMCQNPLKTGWLTTQRFAAAILLAVSCLADFVTPKSCPCIRHRVRKIRKGVCNWDDKLIYKIHRANGWSNEKIKESYDWDDRKISKLRGKNS